MNSNSGARNAPVLEVRNIFKAFGDYVAVKTISFEVYDGEFVFLIGPSGCGKTTTLRMIGGYETPTSGDIIIRGQSVIDVPLEKRNIGMVFQSYALFPHMTVRKNVEFGLRMRNVPRAERIDRVNATLELVELIEYADRYPIQLSGGQRQRVAIARVVVYEPDILLLDEPLANLDKRLRDAMRVELKKLQEKIGITTVYVTHDQEEALSMADKIAVMSHGDLLQIGTPGEIYNRPSTGFVATFLGDTSSFCGEVCSISSGLAHLEMDDGFKTAVVANGNIAIGEKMLVSIRPERVILSTNKPQQTENVFPGVVDFVSYLGSHVVYLVRLDNASALIRVSEQIPHGQAKFSEGEKVYAHWMAEHAIYLKN
jgi:spermidine/putrescine ABC transporter ATP-binding subunit